MVLGIDIGGTMIKFGVIDSDYRIIHRCAIETLAQEGDIAIVRRMIGKIQELQKEFPLEGIGVGTPGQTDSERGICVRAANLPYHNTPMKEMVEEATGLPMILANDATCAICGELVAGVGREYDDFLMITLGTGVGGGIVLGGKAYFGKEGKAGEFGHMIIERDGLPCPCGQKGCYEQYASVTALIRRTKEAAEENPDSILAEICAEKINGKSVFDAVEAGCLVAAQVLDRYLDDVATGIISLARIFEPQAVVLSGAVTEQGEVLQKPLREKTGEETQVLVSELKNDAGIIGAASLVLNRS